MSNANRKIETVKYSLSQVEDPALKERLEQKYIGLEVHKRTQVETIRQAQRAGVMAAKAMAEVQLAELDFIIEAGEAFELITTEPNWVTRRTQTGSVVLECLLTQTDMQDIARAQVKHVREQIQQSSDDEPEPPDTRGLFGES